MANDCAQLRIELAALRAEVAKLKPVDEERIIKKSTEISQAFTLGQLGAYTPFAAYKVLQGKVGTLGNSLDNLRYTTDALGGKVNVATRTATQAKVATDSLGRVVIDQSARLGRLGAIVARLDIALGGALSAIALFNARINALLAKIAPLFNILGLVGAIAGLASLAGILYTVFPRLDGHDRELDALRSISASNSNNIFGVQQAVKRAQYTADVANSKGDSALGQIPGIRSLASSANYTANVADSKGNSALGQIPDIRNTAQGANYTANVADSKGNSALGQLSQMQALVDRIVADAAAANSKANSAVGKANEAINQAAKAVRDANDAIGSANTAIGKANEAIAKFNQVQPIAEQALNKANHVEPIANQALQQISQVRPISEQALTNAFNALNRVNTVEPVANNAFTATQLQGTQLKGTQLEVTGLGNTTKLHDKKIIRLSDRINNFKPPTTSTPEVDKEALEKLTQVIVSVGVLKLAVDNLPRSIPASPNFTGAVTTAAIAANCRTAQPGGCTTRMAENVANTAANNAANKAANDLFGKLANLLNTGLNAAQLALLQPIYKTVTTVNTKLGNPIANGGISGFLTRLSSSLGIDRALNLIGIAANLHNAMMLSASLKVTLLEMLSSVGNATGLLQTSENENVDLNQVFNAGIERFLISILGVDSYAGLKVGLRKYNAIYQSAANSLNAVSSMFNSLGNVVEQGAEYTGRIGNALKSAGMVGENAYRWMAEKFDAKSSKFIKFQSTIGDVTQVLETINEIAETVVEGQQAATEFQKANADFIKAVEDAKKGNPPENKEVQAEAAKAKENATKDPTGELEEGLLSFLTN